MLRTKNISITDFLEKQGIFILVSLLFILAKYLLSDTYFFWDSVATLSKPANFLFENHFSSIAFPADVVDDNLFLSTVLAGIWEIFGRTLATSHILFTGIGLAFIFQIYKLCRYFIPDKTAFPYIFILVLSDPAIVTQSLLIMTDIVLLLFALMSIRYMLLKKTTGFVISLFFLSMMRERGLVLCAGIGLCYFILLLSENQYKKPFRQLGKALLPFIPVFCYFLLFYIYRMYLNQSYSLLRENTPWSVGRHLVDIKYFLKNTVTAGRFFLDYGRCFIWIIFIYIVCKSRKKLLNESSFRLLCILGGSCLFLLLAVTLPITNPFGPRYFMLPFLVFSLIAGLLIFRQFRPRQAKIICTFLIIGLWSGHAWIYPEKISMGWDTTLAHLPYYQLRKEALQYIDNHDIDYRQTSLFFPAASEGKYIELNTDNRKFAEQDFHKNEYALYSNIANWSDEEINSIQQWTLIKEFNKNGVFIRIYKNPGKQDIP